MYRCQSSKLLVETLQSKISRKRRRKSISSISISLSSTFACVGSSFHLPLQVLEQVHVRSKSSATLSEGARNFVRKNYRYHSNNQNHYTSSLFFSTTGNNNINTNTTSELESKRGDDKKSVANLPVPQPIPALDQLKSIPNLITLGRMASTPILSYWIVEESYILAVFGCVLAGLSDAADGFFAKYYDGGTVLGTYLDPLADKVLINSLAISLWYSGILPTPLIVVWASKDVILLIGMGFYLWKDQRTVNFFYNSVATKPLTVTPSKFGKVNTALQFTTLGVGMLSPIMTNIDPLLLQSLCWITGTSSILTVMSYTGQAGFKTTKSGEVTSMSAKSNGSDDKNENTANYNNGRNGVQ